MLYTALTMKNLDYRVVKVIAGTISILLSRKSLLTRMDFQLDWRPLYDLYIDIAYKNLEEVFIKFWINLNCKLGWPNFAANRHEENIEHHHSGMQSLFH